MARAMIKIVCAECGKEFTHTSFRNNRAEANNYEEWAAQNITMCPACYTATKEAKKAGELAQMLAELGIQLPALTGASKKQVAYAELLRTKFLSRNRAGLRKYHKITATITEHAEEFAALCAEKGLANAEEGFALLLAERGLEAVRVALTATEASQILDNNDIYAYR